MVINDLWDTIQKRISTSGRGMVACLRPVEAATEAVLATADIVAMCPHTVHEPHAVVLTHMKYVLLITLHLKVPTFQITCLPKQLFFHSRDREYYHSTY